MKKLLFKMIIILLVIITGFCGYYGYLGYQIYQDKIQEQFLSERVNQLKSKEDYVTLDQISPIYKEAVLESEDRRFYQHGPVDYYGLARAMLTNLTTFSFKEGGSTITQQLSKNLCLSFEKNLSRKFAEVFIARDLEKMYSKDEILEMYLNITYLGEGNYGIQAASQYYYHIDAIDLNKQQSDILVKTLKRPSVYNPSKVN
ncbi:transglycosylase domain-containing protein [Faecalibacillus intestinalis]|uniref:peptidoglycan glycosyltransferase n=1 Tax=Faecalibacillus intestinalis TaxID=1982626 RepID=A0AAP2XSK9_9FIRM|nr:biosynthetic peptidoglycan transglycosylase [Faecalibacillus intestinalis]MCB8591532.1 transglycosylase domain-containing protein [Faecalibacillus intestinalis]MCB8612518.1 transglycosylase domain-containing protein [Faecalibacillus intestinalis]MCG4680188.1 transglycosylase domain-containing protein [Faecalibacillus intestinalis]MCG4712994.1 transglycosylase domain-containing protein [Faecalibacillus intestinalis]MCG4754410.1 transglycosylase domain-containing protein [Faecalibacillus inte